MFSLYLIGITIVSKKTAEYHKKISVLQFSFYRGAGLSQDVQQLEVTSANALEQSLVAFVERDQLEIRVREGRRKITTARFRFSFRSLPVENEAQLTQDAFAPTLGPAGKHPSGKKGWAISRAVE
jgi:hypothetical protein